MSDAVFAVLIAMMMAAYLGVVILAFRTGYRKGWNEAMDAAIENDLEQHGMGRVQP